MATMSDVRSVAAGATVENILDGKINEFLDSPSALQVYATGGGAGVFMTILAGQRVIMNQQEISAKTTFPVLDQDKIASDVVGSNERLTISVRNSTVGALTVRTLVDVTPLA